MKNTFGEGVWPGSRSYSARDLLFETKRGQFPGNRRDENEEKEDRAV
jgi:hypothetical protein